MNSPPEKNKHCFIKDQSKLTEQAWYQCMLQAKNASNIADWSQAISSYSSAFNLSNLLLTRDSFSEQSQIRYTHTCIELAYALSLGKSDMSWLLQSVSQRLSSMRLSATVDSLLQELQRIKTTPYHQLKLERARKNMNFFSKKLH